jgi:hypothetical protein
MNKKPTLQDIEAFLEKHRCEKGLMKKPNADIPVAVPTTQRKPTPVDDNRSDMFLPPKESAKTLEPETPSFPKATSTDRRKVSKRKQKDAKIRCNRCEGCTPHTVHPCNYPEYAGDWLQIVCDVCGSKAYARKDGDGEHIQRNSN